jgi:hypothetical protein
MAITNPIWFGNNLCSYVSTKAFTSVMRHEVPRVIFADKLIEPYI